MILLAITLIWAIFSSSLHAAAEHAMSPRLQLASISNVVGVSSIRGFLTELVTMPDEVVTALLDLATRKPHFTRSLALKYFAEPKLRSCYGAQDSILDIHLCLLERLGTERPLLLMLEGLPNHEAWLDFAGIWEELPTIANMCTNILGAPNKTSVAEERSPSSQLLSLESDWNRRFWEVTVLPYCLSSLDDGLSAAFQNYCRLYSRYYPVTTEMQEQLLILSHGAVDAQFKPYADLLIDFPTILFQYTLPLKEKSVTFGRFFMLVLSVALPVLEKAMNKLERYDAILFSLPLESLRRFLSVFESCLKDKQGVVGDLVLVQCWTSELLPALLRSDEALKDLFEALSKYLGVPEDLLESHISEDSLPDFSLLVRSDINDQVEALPERIMRALIVDDYIVNCNWATLKPVFRYHVGYLTVYGKLWPKDPLPKDPDQIAPVMIQKLLLTDLQSTLGPLALVTAFGRERKILFRQFIDIYNESINHGVDHVVDHLFSKTSVKPHIFMLPMLPGEEWPTNESDLLEALHKSPIDHARFKCDIEHVFLLDHEDNIDGDGAKTLQQIEQSIIIELFVKLRAGQLLDETDLNRLDFASTIDVLVESLRNSQSHPKAVRWLLEHFDNFRDNRIARQNPSLPLLVGALFEAGVGACRSQAFHRVKSAVLKEAAAHVKGESVMTFLESQDSFDTIDSLVITPDASCDFVHGVLAHDLVSSTIPWPTVHESLLNAFPSLRDEAVTNINSMLEESKANINSMVEHWTRHYDGLFDKFFTTYDPKDRNIDDTVSCCICQEDYSASSHIEISQLNTCKHHFHRHCAMSTYQTQEGCPMCRTPFCSSDV